MACDNVAVEFSVEKLTFKYSKPEDFVTSSWKWCGSKLYTTFRFLAMFLLFGYLCFDFFWDWRTQYRHMPAYWLLYGINWIFLGLVITYLFHTVITLKYVLCGRIPSSIVYGGFWALNAISINTCWLMSLVYWMGLHDAPESNFSSISEKSKHIILAAFVFLDMIISAVPVRLCHAIYPISIGLIYTLFNMAYTLFEGPVPSGQKEIYPGMDWRSPGGAGIMGTLIFFIGILIQTVLYAIYVFRCFIREGVNGTPSAEDQGVPSSRTEASNLQSLSHSSTPDRELENVVLPRAPTNYSTIND